MSHLLHVAAVALSKAAAYDNRSLDSQQARELAIQAWAEALHPDTTIQDALNAVTDHYRNTRSWLMVADINALTARYRAARLNLDTVTVPAPEGLGDEPAVEVAWQAAWLEAAKAGDSQATATAKAWAAIGRARPLEIESVERADVRARINELKNKFGKKESA